MTVKMFKLAHMFISLKSNWTNNHKTNRVYLVKIKNQKFINEIFDKLHEQKKMKWFLRFIFFWIFNLCDLKNRHKRKQIWKKKRVIINIRDLNQIIQTNAYFMSFQFDIITIIIECSHISIVDVQKYFYQ